jgi:hypothetical protein
MLVGAAAGLTTGLVGIGISPNPISPIFRLSPLLLP